MALTQDILRGQIDMIILASLQGEDGYGYRITRDIKDQAGAKYELKEATLYSAFRRLEKQGYIRSYWGDEDKGARRRYYTLTAPGRTAFTEMQSDWSEVKTMVDALTGSGKKPARAKAAAKAKPAAAKKAKKG